MKSFTVGAALGLALSVPSVGFAQSVSTVQHNNYGDRKSWLCHPGGRSACDVDLTTTVVAADGTSTLETWKADLRPPIDCFYVYPTVSTDPTSNSDMNADAAELNVVRLQLARFAAKCRLYAPLYRQVTLATLRRALASGERIDFLGVGLDDVRDAWHYYLQHENKGRGFVLIGHSQGSSVLTELIRKEIDGTPVQSRLVSALLLGLPRGVAVPQQKDVGGTFQRVPLCRGSFQTGCVIAYSSFRSTVPPPSNTLFGKVADATMVASCTNPAALDGGEGELRPYLDAKGGTIVNLSPSKPWMLREKPITTPIVSVPGLLTARCASNENAMYLEVTVHRRPGDAAKNEIQGDGPGPNWGLHVVDVELAMGNLLDVVGRQTKSFLASQRKR